MNTVAGLRLSLSPIFRQYNIQKAILFGSLARGEETKHSDVDLILIQETAKRFWDRYDGLMLEIGNAIQGRAVIPLIYTPMEFKAMNERTFIQRAIREGIVLFDCENRETRSGITNAASL